MNHNLWFIRYEFRLPERSLSKVLILGRLTSCICSVCVWWMLWSGAAEHLTFFNARMFVHVRRKFEDGKTDLGQKIWEHSNIEHFDVKKTNISYHSNMNAQRLVVPGYGHFRNEILLTTVVSNYPNIAFMSIFFFVNRSISPCGWSFLQSRPYFIWTTEVAF